uniref:Dirigent protein n=1 Tax=Setaria digitata TaxID=48799 RepID=A0A915Q7P8_9BILA
MLHKSIFIISWFTVTISGEYKIPIRFGNVTLYDRSDGRKDVVIRQGIDIGGYGGISGHTFFERNGTFETSNAGALLLGGKLYGNNETLTYNKQGIEGGPGKEGLVFGQFLNHVSQAFLTGLEKATKSEKTKLFRRRRRQIS